MNRFLRRAPFVRAARRLAFLGVVAGSLAAASCVSKPVVAVHHAELSGATFQGVGMNVVLSVRNDNGYDVQIRSVRITTTLQGKYQLDPLNYAPNIWLAADQSTLVNIPVVIPWRLVPTLVSESVGSPSIAYSVSGLADVTAVRFLGVRRDDYPINESGTVPRQMLVDAAARSLLPF